jgi:hypothetical protein
MPAESQGRRSADRASGDPRRRHRARRGLRRNLGLVRLNVPPDAPGGGTAQVKAQAERSAQLLAEYKGTRTAEPRSRRSIGPHLSGPKLDELADIARRQGRHQKQYRVAQRDPHGRRADAGASSSLGHLRRELLAPVGLQPLAEGHEGRPATPPSNSRTPPRPSRTRSRATAARRRRSRSRSTSSAAPSWRARLQPEARAGRGSPKRDRPARGARSCCRTATVNIFAVTSTSRDPGGCQPHAPPA